MTRGLSEGRTTRRSHSPYSANGSDGKPPLRRLVGAVVRFAKGIDNWVSRGVEAPRRDESGWYIHTGEGKAIAAGAAARNGAEAEISRMLRSRESRLAMHAVQLAEAPSQGDYGDYLDVVSRKYEELLAGGSSGAKSDKGTAHIAD